MPWNHECSLGKAEMIPECLGLGVLLMERLKEAIIGFPPVLFHVLHLAMSRTSGVQLSCPHSAHHSDKRNIIS